MLKWEATFELAAFRTTTKISKDQDSLGPFWPKPLPSENLLG